MFDSQRTLAFVNTRLDRPTGLIDQLADRDAAAGWLAGELGYDSPISGRDHAALLELRDSARWILRARSAGLTPPPQDLDVVNAASVAAPRAEQLDGDWNSAVHFAASGSPDANNLTELLAGLASAVVNLAAASENLVECAADDCVVLFLRTDPRRRWHSKRCGNRVRAARSFARHRSGGPP
ncbi:CGNR zinc finger domain-containing protein [Streptomyces wuyuanensis]|uniref:CGNR zinc finger domain-containing protein n=1 Tax=Streptomyces wuyuanensis TaxID=1196353 RepID=UPI0014305844|nr:CGNR zinc finger domain-containing protein [Streptomyces wuyuanensis]